jgi:hypothetical protein
MSNTDCEFQLQQQFGQLMDRGSYLIFQAQVTRPEAVVSWHIFELQSMQSILLYFSFLLDLDISSGLLRP